MADITLNPIALLKTVVVITAAVSVGYLIAHKDAAGTAERQGAILERMEAEQQARQLEAERLELLPPAERQRAQQVQLWGEERVQQMEQERAERRAGWETRTFGEALGDRVPAAPAEPEREGEPAPAPEPAAQPERRVMSFDTMGAERQRAAAQAAREQRENTGTEQPSD
ncbi:hypothetical protein [Ectothiorhodospira shaposhnikovii]|uniref:hypothetical protein n=1 Tax=Ectothiorhodospira shaposhnikovii TaxID=1054 RepID=UPI0039A1EFBD